MARDDCIVTNGAITRMILRSVNPKCCIASDTASQSVTQAVVGTRDSEGKRCTGVKKYLFKDNTSPLKTSQC